MKTSYVIVLTLPRVLSHITHAYLCIIFWKLLIENSLCNNQTSGFWSKFYTEIMIRKICILFGLLLLNTTVTYLVIMWHGVINEIPCIACQVAICQTHITFNSLYTMHEVLRWVSCHFVVSNSSGYLTNKNSDNNGNKTIDHNYPWYSGAGQSLIYVLFLSLTHNHGAGTFQESCGRCWASGKRLLWVVLCSSK